MGEKGRKDSTPGKTAGKTLHVGLLLTAPALVAWLTGQPFIFPSLGPSAFAMVIEGMEKNRGRNVIGGHLYGLLGGLLAYNAVAQGLSFTPLTPLSTDTLRLSMSGVLSVILTTAAMLVSGTTHPPACATTLIVSLGLLATFRDAFFIMLAVVLMFCIELLLVHISGKRC